MSGKPDKAQTHIYNARENIWRELTPYSLKLVLVDGWNAMIVFFRNGRQVRFKVSDTMLAAGLNRNVDGLGAGKYDLFCSTSKMNTRSWSTPGGPEEMSGTCPASDYGGFAEAYDPHLVKDAKATLMLPEGCGVDKQDLTKANLKSAICSYCYALKGNYGNASQQLKQAVCAAWAYRMAKEGRFVEEMVRAIRHDQAQGKLRLRKEESTTYFRIHDSGDCLFPWEVDGWNEIARQMPDIRFWAPTRAWTFEEHLEIMREAPPNLVWRPSALLFERQPPEIAGLAGGTAGGLIDAVAPLDARGKPVGKIEKKDGKFFLYRGYQKLGKPLGRFKTLFAARQRRSELLDQIPKEWRAPSNEPPPWPGTVGPHHHCRAYLGPTTHSCAEAIGPDGRPGCRVCWGCEPGSKDFPAKSDKDPSARPPELMHGREVAAKKQNSGAPVMGAADGVAEGTDHRYRDWTISYAEH